MNRVHKHVRAHGFGEPARALQVVERAERVRGSADGDELGALVHLTLEIVPVERARPGVHANDAERDAALARKRLPWRDVGVMIKLCDDDLVARRERATERARDVEGERRRIRAEDYFVGSRAEKVCHALARLLDYTVGLRARRIGPVRVGVVMIEIVAHGLDHAARDLRAAGAVEVGDREAFMLALKRGKVRPYLFGGCDGRRARLFGCLSHHARQNQRIAPKGQGPGAPCRRALCGRAD